MMKEIRGYKKEEMLYPDRCMLKWQGMLLSDHTEKMKDDQKEKAKQQEKEKTEDP